MRQCPRCKRSFIPYVDRIQTIVDEEFVSRFGWSEYFGQADKIFVNAVPHSIGYDMVTDHTKLIILDAFYACPFCDLVYADDPEPYYKNVMKALQDYERRKHF
jgi:uncharacterized C2H2 Zn-finger protein